MKMNWTIKELEQLKADKKQLAQLSRQLYERSAAGNAVDWTAANALKKSIQARRYQFYLAVESA